MFTGNELIQYEPQDDLSSLPLFDLVDTIPGLDIDDHGLGSNGFGTLNESEEADSNVLLTPQIDTDFLTRVKTEHVD